MTKTKMTLDKLAGMMQREFSGVKKEFSGVKKEFELVHKEINEVKMRDSRIERKLDAVVEKQDEQGIVVVNHEKRISTLEKEKV